LVSKPLQYLLILLGLVAAWPAHANPFDAYGAGARSTALGGAATAGARDFSANYYNPALLPTLETMEISFGYLSAQPSLKLNDGDLNLTPSRGSFAGVSLPRNLSWRRLAVSLSLYLPNQFITRVRSLPEGQPRFVLYDNRPQRIVVTSSLAFEVVKDLFIGASLSYLSNTRGLMEMQGEVHLNDPNQTLLMGGVDIDFASIRYPTFGVHWRPDEHWRFGLSLREPFHLKLDVGLVVDGDIVTTVAGQKVPLLEDGQLKLISHNTNLFSPRQLNLGVGYEGSFVHLYLDVGWYQWSSFPTPTAYIDTELDLAPLDFEVPTSKEPLKPNFTDVFVPRLGLELTTIENDTLSVESRLGYFYEPSPAPDQPETTNYVDNNKHGFSLGLGLEFRALKPLFPRPVSLDLAAQAIWMQPRTYSKDDPADMVGSYRSSGWIFSLSSNVNFRF
jgi:long-chain fatty acid transport protein